MSTRTLRSLALRTRPLAAVAGALLSLPFLLPTPAGAYMAILRQGVESAEVPNALDHYGKTIATGDFDGDGYEDIAVAAPDENNDIGAGGKHGVVIISYGSARGIVHEGASVLSVGVPTDFNVYFGKSLAAGDFNGDGVDDLAVGVPGLDGVSDDDIGSVWVYAGMKGVGISLAPYAQLFQEDCGTTSEAGDEFGSTLAAGDMNLDGFADLFVGSTGEDNDAGLVGFFPGSATGVSTTGSGFAKQSGLGGANEPGSLFGYSLTVGDFFDDEYLDLAIGAPYADDGARTDAGKVYLVRGTAFGPVVAGAQVITSANLGVSAQPGSGFGWSLAAGHYFEKWGRADLAIGEPFFDLPGATDSGRVVVVEYDDAPVQAPFEITQDDVAGVAQPGATFGWSLAAGNIMTAFGEAGPDDYADLAIGAPLADVLVPGSNEGIYWQNAGAVYLAPGVGNGFVFGKAKVLDALERNDLWFSFDENMGWSVDFGKFDDTGWDNLAIGVPRKHYPAFIATDTVKQEAGQVYVMAPWRQPAGRPHRGSIVFDCENRIYFAQRPWQQLTPASTTKALTALIAVEAIANGEVDPNEYFTIPAWVANSVTGSQYGLFPGERMRFIDLVRTMIAVSGNDCAYAIGNILTGEDNVWDAGQTTEWNLEHVLQDFADRMNQRAAQIGMSPAHHFTNPAGRPVGDHWTTAADMALFVDAAMENPDFRDVVGTISWNGILRLVPQLFVFPWLPPSFNLVPVVDDVSNGYFSAISSRFTRARGVKGGSNGPSMATGLYAGELDNGYVKATIMGVPPYGALADFGAELMSLVDQDCQPKPIDPSQVPDFPYAHATGPNVPMGDGSVHFITASINTTYDDTDDTRVSIARQRVATPTTCFTGLVRRSMELELAAQEFRTFGAQCANNLKQIGLAVHNFGDASVRLRLTALQTQYVANLSLEPGQSWELPAEAIPTVDAPQWTYLLENLAVEGTARVMVEEKGYGLQACLGDGRASSSVLEIDLLRGGPTLLENIVLAVQGNDATEGNTVDLSIHPASVGTAVDGQEGVPTPMSGAVLGLENHPNPFNPRTTVSFELAHEAAVTLKIYDVAGRLVRVLESGAVRPAGRHQATWDGTDLQGRSVGSGVYLARIDDGATVLTRSMMLLK